MKTRKLKKALRRMRLQEGDLLLLRGDLPANTPERIQKAALSLMGAGVKIPRVAMVYLGAGALDTVDEEHMRRAGWVRA